MYLSVSPDNVADSDVIEKLEQGELKIALGLLDRYMINGLDSQLHKIPR